MFLSLLLLTLSICLPLLFCRNQTWIHGFFDLGFVDYEIDLGIFFKLEWEFGSGLKLDMKCGFGFKFDSDFGSGTV